MELSKVSEMDIDVEEFVVDDKISLMLCVCALYIAIHHFLVWCNGRVGIHCMIALLHVEWVASATTRI